MFTPTTPAEVKECYDNIEKGLTDLSEKYSKMWTEKVTDGDDVAADSRAMSKFNEAATALIEFQAKSDISNLAKASGTLFKINISLILRKTSIDKDLLMNEEHFSVEYPAK